MNDTVDAASWASSDEEESEDMDDDGDVHTVECILAERDLGDGV